MRILFVAHSYPPTSLGGVATYTQSIVHALASRGHEVSVLCVDNWLDASLAGSSEIRITESNIEGVRTTRLRFHAQETAAWLPLNDVWNPIVEHYARRYYIERVPDVVHVTGWVGMSPSVIAAARKLGIPVVLTLTDYGLICPTANLLTGDGSLCAGRRDGVDCLGCTWGKQSRTYRWLIALPRPVQKFVGDSGAYVERVAFRRTGALQLVAAIDARNRLYKNLMATINVILAPSQFLREMYCASGIVAPGRIRYQAHGHDVEAAAVGRYKTPSTTLRFAYLGRIVPYKGLDILLNAFLRLPDSMGTRLDIYGDLLEIPEYGEKLMALAGRSGTIHFRGHFGRADIGDVLANTDVVVLPSICYENAPVVIAEAFAAGTPVITTDLGGMAELVRHEGNGLLFRRGDINDLAAQMYKLIVDSELLQRLISGAGKVKAVLEEVGELEGIYADLCKETCATHSR